MGGFLGGLFLFFSLAGCAPTDTTPESLQMGKQDGLPVRVEGGNLRQGLAIVYFYQKFRHVDEMPNTEDGIAKFGHPGPPIMKLDNQFGKGNVFASGRNTEVGVLMRGYLHLDRAGEYLFQAKSNDGFQLFVDGNLIVSDPGIHGDRISQTGKFRVVEAGMFPVEIKYFQRKGTAMLQLFWLPAGASYYSIVPGAAFSHMTQ